jgi:hypothetical protein
MNSTLIENKNFKNLIFQEVDNYFDDNLKNNVLYEEGIAINTKSYNYINLFSNYVIEKTFKPLIENEFLKFEKHCPGMGEVFLNIVMQNLNDHRYVFANNNIQNKLFFDKVIKPLELLEDKIIASSHHFSKKDWNEFLEDEINKENKFFIKDLINLMGLKSNVFVETGYGKKTYVEKSNDISFDLSFDNDFLLTDVWNAKDYNFIIIDGFIDSVGEIVHLLQEANENNEPYVIFCKGMHLDVKNVIMQNLARKTINVLPVSLEINELNINILADIAMCHNSSSDMVSHLKGDTISKAVRNKLKKGKSISVKKGKITLTPKASSNRIDTHLRYLSKKKANADVEQNTVLLEKRIKMLSSDKIVIKIANQHLRNKNFNRDLNLTLSNLKMMIRGCCNCNDIKYFNDVYSTVVSTVLAVKILKSAKSMLTVIYNTSGCVIFE